MSHLCNESWRMPEELQLTIEPLIKKNKFPLISITVNNKRDELYLKEKLVFNVTLDLPRTNYISIAFLNKDPSDTVVKDGGIVEDLAVMLQSISYKSFNFHPYLAYVSEYRKDCGDIVEGTNGFMGFNGTLELKLKTPLFITARELGMMSNKNFKGVGAKIDDSVLQYAL